MDEYLPMRITRFLFVAFVLWGIVLGAVACRGDENTEIKLGDVLFQDYGTRSVRGLGELTLDAGSFYFSPTFLRGGPGQEVTLHIRNVSSAHHNFAIEEQGINVDIEVDQEVDVKVRFPQSGALLFTCLFHRYDGMNGELLVGNATPKLPFRSNDAGT